MRLGMKERTSFYQTLQSGPFHAVLQPFAGSSFSIRTKILFSFFVDDFVNGDRECIDHCTKFAVQISIRHLIAKHQPPPTASMAPSNRRSTG